MGTVCPKCSYERRELDDSFVSVLECPRCGIIYSRFIPIEPQEALTASPQEALHADNSGASVPCGDHCPPASNADVNNAPSATPELHDSHEAETPEYSSLSDQVSVFRVIGLILLVSGLVASFYYYMSFDVSVESGGQRIVNLGLMHQRQMGVLFGFGSSILGGVLIWLGNRGVTILGDDEKKCPFCAEKIKADASLCRYCGRDL